MGEWVDVDLSLSREEIEAILSNSWVRYSRVRQDRFVKEMEDKAGGIDIVAALLEAHDAAE